MRVIGKETLEDFKRRHADVRSQVDTWLAEVEDAEWDSPNDIKARFAAASFLPNNRVVFNLKGNSYRLDVNVAYNTKVVLIKRIGTHAEYDTWTF
ncbi:MAG: type II toxin-antitoxin system HigB family toxin [Planctomycetia bacterium]|nr:type II toxin-antitoxin system HigB family toxin [Planctomycetia bacterium]